MTEDCTQENIEFKLNYVNTSDEGITWAGLREIYNEVVDMDHEIKCAVKSICFSGEKPFSTITDVMNDYGTTINLFNNIWSFNYEVDKITDLKKVHSNFVKILKKLID